jgi:hypothetical protein
MLERMFHVKHLNIRSLDALKSILKNTRWFYIMEKLFTLKNGVQMFSTGLENNFDLAQEILDLGTATENIDAHYAYNERVSFAGVGTYEIKVERREDFERFEEMLDKEKSEEKMKLWTERRREAMEIVLKFEDGIITREEETTLINEIHERYNKMFASCKKGSFEVTFEEWKEGKTTKGMKLGKALGKAKFSKELLDFYSQQIRTEKSVYLTISDHVQNIAGMSNFFEEGSTNFYGGTSCQDTRLDTGMSISLGGSLWDNKLFVGMLHENMEDVHDMQDKLLARVVLRYVHIDGSPCLIPSQYYGNNETMSALHYALNQLSEMEIYSEDVRDGDLERVKERTNGYLEIHQFEDIYFCETFEDEVEVQCPMCYGDETVTRYNSCDNEIEVSCPCCSGSGVIHASYYIDIDEWVEVETEQEIAPYADDYTHCGSFMTIRVNEDLIKEKRRAIRA